MDNIEEKNYIRGNHKDLSKAKAEDRLFKQKNLDSQRLEIHLQTGEETDNWSKKRVTETVTKLQLGITSRIIQINDRNFVKRNLKNVNIQIECFGDNVAKEDRFNFIKPLIFEKPEDINIIDSLIKDTKTINVKITNRRPDKFRVYYTGVITNDRNEAYQFKNIDNNFCVNL